MWDQNEDCISIKISMIRDYANGLKETLEGARGHCSLSLCNDDEQRAYYNLAVLLGPLVTSLARLEEELQPKAGEC